MTRFAIACLFIALVPNVAMASSVPLDSGSQVRGGAPRPLAASATIGRFISPASASTALNVGFLLKGQHQDEVRALETEQANPRSPLYHRWLTPAQYGAYFGATPSAIRQTVSALRRLGYSVTSAPLDGRFIHARASVGLVEATLDTPIDVRRIGSRTFLTNRYDARVPTTLPQVTAVGGLDTYRRFRPHIRVGRPGNPRPQLRGALVNVGPPHPNPHATMGNQFAFAPADIYTAYDWSNLFSSGDDGRGFTIAIFETRQPLQSDLNNFDQTFGVQATSLHETFLSSQCPTPCPEPTTADDVSESALDSQWAHAAAPGAALDTISVGDDLVDSWLVGYEYIVDVIGQGAQVVSTSYGTCETSPTPDYLPPYERDGISALVSQGVAEGQTWVAASGDAGVDDCGQTDFDPLFQNSPTVDFPASLPDVVAVGGTEMDPQIVLGNVVAYGPEFTWNESYCNLNPPGGATGGGESVFYPKPSWQVGKTISADAYRDVPDVGMLASQFISTQWPSNCTLEAGYWFSDENFFVATGGTSFGAPIWAGIFADIASKEHSAVGLAGPELYALQGGPYHQITVGDNTFDGIQGFMASSGVSGYNKVTGLGTPDVDAFVQQFTAFASPTPQATTFPALSPNPAPTAASTPPSRAIVMDAGLPYSSPMPTTAPHVDVFNASFGSEGTLIQQLVDTGVPVDVAYNATGSIAYVLDLNGRLDSVALSSEPYTLTTNIEPTFVTRASSLAFKSSFVYIAGTLAKAVSAIPVPASVVRPAMIGVGNDPVRIVANPVHRFVYVANVADDTVSVINAMTNKNVQTLAVGAEPTGLAVSPDGSTLVVANEGDGTATIVNVATNPAQIESTVFVGGEPTSVTINTDGSRAYLANLFCPGNGLNCDPDGHSPNGVVEAVLLNSMPPTTQCCVVVGEAPTDIEFDPTGRYLWVINSRSETVTVVDSQTNTVVSSTNMSALSLQAGSRFISAIP